MDGIKFSLDEPYAENGRFGICIDRIDYNKRKIDSKYIMVDKTFCLFELPKLGVKNTERIISEKNLEAQEWLKLYAKKIFDHYVANWKQQPEVLRLMCGRNYPSLQELRSV